MSIKQDTCNISYILHLLVLAQYVCMYVYSLASISGESNIEHINYNYCTPLEIQWITSKDSFS